MAKIGEIHYNWPGYDLEGFARRASENGGSFSYINPVGEGGGEEKIDLAVRGEAEL